MVNRLTDDIFLQSVKQFPDWGKMRFVNYPAKPWSAILDGAAGPALEFVSSLVQYEGTQRMTAAQVWNFSYFRIRQLVVMLNCATGSEP